MTHPTISVIIPLFSQESLARRAISSVLEQSLRPDELILVDDAQIAWVDSEYLDAIRKRGINVKYIKNQVNLGSAASLNLGMSICKTDIFCLFNDDDIFSTNRLSEIIRVSLSSDFNKFWGYSHASIIDSNGKSISTSGYRDIDRAIVESQSNFVNFQMVEKINTAISSGNLFLSKKVYDLGYRFDESLKHVHDWYFVQQLFLQADPVLLNETTYFYRIHDSNTFKIIDLDETALECYIVGQKIRSQLWTSVSRERILELLSFKVLGMAQEGVGSRKNVGVINYRAYAIVDRFISKFHKRSKIFRLVSYLGKKIEKY